MERKKHFERYYSRFMWEGIIKSLLCGLIVGFALNFIAAFATWFTAFNGFWLAIALLAVGTAASAPIFYFKIFRPTVESNAKRIDRYGLEERLITMVEFENDTSYLAQRQRQDAAEKLAQISVQQIEIKIPKLAIIFTVVATILGAGMTTVNGLAEAGILPGGGEIIDNMIPDPDPVYIEVTYMVNEGGIIEGDEAQIVLLGGNTTEVVAIPDDGYAFDGWDDGGKRPTRSDSGITEDVIYTAIFLPLGDNGEGDGDGDQAGKGDQPGDQPGDGEGEGEGPSNPNSNSNSGAGGQYLECNQVIDGETYYGSLFDSYRTDAIEGITENVEMSSGMKDFINNYYDIIYATDPDAAESGE